MNRQDILTLESMRNYPCLTITLPTHRTAPENRQDSIRLKNLTRQAAERLTDEVGKHEAATMLQSLEQLADSIDHTYNLEGLALFVSADVARAERLPCSLPERVIIDESFFTRDLVYALNRSPHYWVLVLSEQPTRLFEAFRDDLHELTNGAFPMFHTGPGGERSLPNDPAINASRFRDEHHRIFFRTIDQSLTTVLASADLPVVVVGVDRWLSFFNEVTGNAAKIIATFTGNYDRASSHELGKLVWPLVQEKMAERCATVLDELDVAVGGQRSASTLGEVWRCAQEGRGATLVVEESYHEAAALDETGLRLLPRGDGVGRSDLDDAVDEVIATVLAKGGRVVFVADGTLTAHSRIALILRY